MHCYMYMYAREYVYGRVCECICRYVSVIGCMYGHVCVGMSVDMCADVHAYECACMLV